MAAMHPTAPGASTSSPTRSSTSTATRPRPTTDYLFVRPGADGLAIVAAGRYHDRLVRQGTRWRFTERTITMLGDESGPDG